MSLAYLLDENQRGRLWHAVQKHNATGMYPIDAVRVGDRGTLQLGTLDPDILLWTEQQDRVLVSFDRNSLPRHLANHLVAGHHSPGLFLIRRAAAINQVVSFLVIAAHASDGYEWRHRIEYIG